MFDKTKWPVNCPPHDSISPDASLVVYRIVTSDPPTDADFMSYHELGKPVSGGAKQQCRSRSVSVFRDKNEAIALALSTNLGQFIAKGTLNHLCGVIELSRRSSHVSWWPCDDITRRLGFTDVEKV